MDPIVLKTGVKRIRLSKFEKHYLNEETKDVTLVVKGVRIPAHKIILSTTSDVFERLFYIRKDENNNSNNTNNRDKDVVEIKETTPEVIKLLLKYIYFDEFDANDITKDYTLAIDVFKLSFRFDIKVITNLIEEELAQMIRFDNFVAIADLASFYKLPKLLDAFKEFVSKNEKLLISYMEKGLLTDPIETSERVINFLNLSQKQVIQALNNIAAQDLNIKDWNKYQVFIKFELCSVKELNALKSSRLFEQKDLDKIIEQKFEDLENRWKLSNTRCDTLTTELDGKNGKYVDLSTRYADINSRFLDLLANYKEAKDIFMPFVDGVGGRVNQYVYNKTNCYLGKVPKKFAFKH